MARRHELELGQMRTDRGLFIDKGNYSVDPRHPDFGGGGARGDGINDDGRAFNDARAHLPTEGGTIIVGPGDYLLTTAFTYGSQDNVVLWLMPGVVLTGAALPADSGNNFLLDWRSGNIGSSIGLSGSAFTTPISTTDATAATSTITGSGIFAGGVGISGALWVGGLADVTGAVNVQDTTSATSTITGSGIFAGGVGIAENLHIGGDLFIGGDQTFTGQLIVDDTTNAISSVTGSIQTDGGLGVVLDTVIGGDLAVGSGVPQSGVHIRKTSSAGAALWIEATDQSASNKVWRIAAEGTQFIARVFDDAYTFGTSTDWLKVNRSGLTISQIEFSATEVLLTATLAAGNAGLGGAASSTTTRLALPASTTAASSLRMPHGSAPTSPTDGDTWTTSSGIFVRVSGTTVGPLIDTAGPAAAGTLTGATLAANVLASSLTSLGTIASLTVTTVADVTGTSQFSGNVGIGQAASTAALQVTETTNAVSTVVFTHSSATSPVGIVVDYSADTPDGTGNFFFVGQDSTNNKIELRSNGGVANFTANDVNLSDGRLKQSYGVIDPVLDKLMNIEVVGFRYLTNPDTRVYSGVIAQQVKDAAPALFSEEGMNDFYGVHQTDIGFWVLKGLQEAVERIKALEEGA